MSGSESTDKIYHPTSRIMFAGANDWIIEHFLTALVRAEFRSVLLKEGFKLDRAIAEYPHSLVFMNIEKNPEGKSWFDLVLQHEDDFKEHRSLPVFVGKQTREQIMKQVNLQIPFEGFDMGKSPKQILSLMYACIRQWYKSGKRQHIRVHCSEREKARFNFKADGGEFQGHILDVSSAGAAITFDRGHEPDKMQKGLVLKSIQLILHSHLILVDGVVMGSRRDDSLPEGVMWIVVFSSASDSAGSQKIKSFVQEQLQAEFDQSLN